MSKPITVLRDTHPLPVHPGQVVRGLREMGILPLPGRLLHHHP